MTYAELYEKITEAEERNENVILDIDEGMFLMTSAQAMEVWDNLAPGQGAMWIDPDSEEAQDAHDLTMYSLS